MEYIYYIFDPSSYEISGPYKFKEATSIINQKGGGLQILKLIVDEFGKVV